MTAHRLRRVLVAAAITAVAFARVLANPGSVIGRPEGELRDHMWLAWVFAQELGSGSSPMYSALGGAPDGMAVYPLDPLHQLVIALVSPFVGLVAGLNVQAALAYFALAYGAQKLAAGRGVLIELTMAVLAALSPAFLGAFADSQTEGMAAGWLLCLLSELFAERPRPWRAAAWGAVLLATGPYLAHGIALVAVACWFFRRLPLLPTLPVIAVAATLGATMWHTEFSDGGALTGRSEQMRNATRPPRSTPLGVRAPPPLPDTGVVRHLSDYPGASETGPRRAAPWFFGALVLLALRERKARIPAALAAAYALVALGNRWGATQLEVTTPYDLFWRLYPGARYAWKPAQYAVPATAFALMAVAHALPGLPPQWRRVGLAMAGGAVIELLARSSTPLPLPASTLVPREVWRALPSGGALIEFPCRDRSPPGVPPVSDVLLGPLWHGRALGETNRAARGVHLRVLDALERGAAGAPGPGFDAAMRAAADAGFTDILVLGALLGDGATERLERSLLDAGARAIPASADARVWPDGVRHYRLGAPAE
ncbi:MAG: hypothetical protein EXR71_13895 [Myxococcales bacterium]|nr:hypothetical protein [Myxococcales bacterium]